MYASSLGQGVVDCRESDIGSGARAGQWKSELGRRHGLHVKIKQRVGRRWGRRWRQSSGNLWRRTQGGLMGARYGVGKKRVRGRTSRRCCVRGRKSCNQGGLKGARCGGRRRRVRGRTRCVGGGARVEADRQRSDLAVLKLSNGRGRDSGDRCRLGFAIRGTNIGNGHRMGAPHTTAGGGGEGGGTRGHGTWSKWVGSLGRTRDRARVGLVPVENALD